MVKFSTVEAACDDTFKLGACQGFSVPLTALFYFEFGWRSELVTGVGELFYLDEFVHSVRPLRHYEDEVGEGETQLRDDGRTRSLVNRTDMFQQGFLEKSGSSLLNLSLKVFFACFIFLRLSNSFPSLFAVDTFRYFGPQIHF
jgi:hypothetical protein